MTALVEGGALIWLLAPAALLLSFTWENKKRTKDVLDYFEGVFAGREMPAWDGPYTRGHFRRGVK